MGQLFRRRGKYAWSERRFRRRTPIFAGALFLVSAVPAIAQMPYTTDAVSPTRYAAVHGRNALLGGNAAAGLEGWAYPLQVFRGLQPSFRLPGHRAILLPCHCSAALTTRRRRWSVPMSVPNLLCGRSSLCRMTCRVPFSPTRSIRSGRFR